MKLQPSSKGMAEKIENRLQKRRFFILEMGGFNISEHLKRLNIRTK
jgi:hypothetical protein